MWRQVSFAAGTLPTRTTHRNPSESGVDAHSHSPRRNSTSARTQLPPPHMSLMRPPAFNAAPRAASDDPFTNGSAPTWRHASGSSADVSMPDYSTSSAVSSRRMTESIAHERDHRRYQNLQSQGAVDTLCEALKTVRDSRSGSSENPNNVAVLNERTPVSTEFSVGRWSPFFAPYATNGL